MSVSLLFSKINLFFLVVTLFSANSWSLDYQQDPQALKSKLEKRPQAALSEQTHKLLTRAQEDLNSGAKDRAFGLYEKLLKRTQSNKSEYAQVLQSVGYAYAGEDKNDKALKTFEKALDLDALPLTPTLSVMYIVGQIYALKGNHLKSVEVLQLWLKIAPEPSGTAYAMLAGSLYELDKKKEALVAIQKAIDLTPKPKESWLSLAVSLYFANKKYLEAAKVLKILVAQNPEKESYWKQWASSYLSAGQETKALSAMEIAEIQGVMNGDKDIKNTVSLLMSTEIPYKAALWMENKLSASEKNDIKTQKLLASAYMSARENEKAIDVLRNIHKNQPEAKTSIQLGQILLEEEKWSEAISVFEKAKSLKPAKDQKEDLYVGIGVAQYNLGKIDLSREAFIKVAEDSKAAEQWLDFIQAQ